MKLRSRQAIAICTLAVQIATCQEITPSRNLVSHVTWSIYHEGCRVYIVPPGAPPLEDRIRPLRDLRDCFLKTQQHNPDATKLIVAASDPELEKAILEAVKIIPDEYSLRAHFEWVAVHEGQLSAFIRLDSAELYEGIRAIYASKQAHNPNAHHLLAAVQNKDVRKLITDISGSVGPEPNSNFVTNRSDDTVIIIDPTKVSGRFAAQLQLKVLSSASWQSVKVQRPETLKDWIVEHYGTREPSAILQIAQAVALRSGLGQFPPLIAGEVPLSAGHTLSAPLLPVVPQGSSNPDVFQAIDHLRQTVTTTRYGTEETFDLNLESASKTSAWVVSLPTAALGTAYLQLPPDASYKGPTFQTANLIVASSDAGCSGAKGFVPVDVGIRSAADSFTTTDKLYVLDFFDPHAAGPCPHGQKVLDVIHQTLKDRGFENLFQANVIPIELDFFRHQTELSHYVEEYIAAQDSKFRPALLAFLQQEKKRDVKTVQPFETPILYIQAVYFHILQDPKASVVSSEYYTESSSFSLLPPPPTFAQNSRPVMLTALSDESLDVESFPLEPIHTFYEFRRDYPMLLIGGIKHDGTTFGMTSTNGDGISCFGYGDGWGGGGTCVKPSDNGTSFSTPSVAAAVFLARALWFKDSGTFPALAMRDRLLHAVPIIDSLSEHCTAPGIPDLAWLGTGQKSVLVDTSSKAIGVISITGTVRYSDPGSNNDSTMAFGTGVNSISGVQHAGARDFIFYNGTSRWKPVVLLGLSLTVKFVDGSKTSFTDPGVFKSTYKGALQL